MGNKCLESREDPDTNLLIYPYPKPKGILKRIPKDSPRRAISGNKTQKIIQAFCINLKEQLMVPNHPKYLINTNYNHDGLEIYDPESDSISVLNVVVAPPIESGYNKSLSWPILLNSGLYCFPASDVIHSKFVDSQTICSFNIISNYQLFKHFSVISSGYNSEYIYCLIQVESSVPYISLHKFNTKTNEWSKFPNFSLVNVYADYKLCCFAGVYIYVFSEQNISRISLLREGQPQEIINLDNIKRITNLDSNVMCKPTALLAQISYNQILIAGDKEKGERSLPNAYIYNIQRNELKEVQPIVSPPLSERYNQKPFIIFGGKVIISTVCWYHILKYNIVKDEWEQFWTRKSLNNGNHVMVNNIHI